MRAPRYALQLLTGELAGDVSAVVKGAKGSEQSLTSILAKDMDILPSELTGNHCLGS